MKRLAPLYLLVTVLVAAPFLVAAPQEVVTENYTLDHDIVFSGDKSALVVGASGITIDLNGHSVMATDGHALSESIGIDNTAGYDNVTIKNGSIKNCGWGVLASGADGMLLENLHIESAGWFFWPGGGGGTGSIGVAAEDGKDLTVRNVLLSDAVFGFWLVSVASARLEHVHAKDCFWGGVWSTCLFGGPTCPPSPLAKPSTGVIAGCDLSGNIIGLQIDDTDDLSIEASRFSRNRDAGIFAGWQGVAPSNVRVKGCQLHQNTFGILALSNGPAGPLPLRDLEIVDNSVSDNVRGMALVNMKDSLVSGNRLQNRDFGIVLFHLSSGNLITENTAVGHGRWGIALIPILNDFNLPGATGNTIAGNTAMGNGLFDLFHTLSASPNTWVANKFRTSSGVDIQ